MKIGSLLVILLLAMSSGEPPHGGSSPDPGLFTVPFSMASFSCVECGECPPDDHWTDWFMPFRTYNGPDHAGQCYSGSCGDSHPGICGGEDDLDQFSFALVESELEELAVVLEALREALSTQESVGLKNVVEANASRMDVVKSRAAIQVRGGCDGGIVAHFPLQDWQLKALED